MNLWTFPQNYRKYSILLHRFYDKIGVLVINMNGKNLNLAFSTEKIYEDANFHIEENDKVGVVGVNGAGKTTLFRVILGEQELDSGKLIISKKKRIGYLPQEIVLDDRDMTVFEYLLKARPIEELETKLTNLYQKVAEETDEKQQRKLLKEIGKTQELLEYYDCYQAESILFQIIDDMHIDSSLLDMKLMDLSGGQKSKIAFAHLLYSNPEILLLDEPTNHLDIDTRDYIIQYLKNYHGMVLVISHDINFLNQIVTKIMHLDKISHKISVYQGDYDTYLKKKEKEKEARERLIEKQEKETQKLRDIVLLYSNSSGKRKRMAQSREKMLEKKMKEQLVREKSYKKVKLHIEPRREGSKIPLKVNNISFHYPDSEKIINNLSFLINHNERFLIVGENGVGKSTLLKLLASELKPQEGNIWFGNKTDLAYYAQEQELLDENKTI